MQSPLLGAEIKGGEWKEDNTLAQEPSPREVNTLPFHVHLLPLGWRKFDNKSFSCLSGINRAC